MLGSRRLTIAGGASLAAAIVVLSAGTLSGADPAVLRPVEADTGGAAVTTTSIADATPVTAPTTTTTTLPPPPVLDIGPLDTEVATAVGTHVTVYENIPQDQADDTESVIRMVDLPTLAFSGEKAGAPEIPSMIQPVQGRGRTGDGWVFANPTPWGNPLVFAVTERKGAWIRVMLPVRPNGAQGWVHHTAVSLSVIDTHVVVDLSDASLAAFSGGDLIAQSAIVIGAAKSPTPTGRFFVTDYDPKYRGSAYGPWVLPLSGFSQAMNSFAGGVPVIAMHGTNRPELVGGAHSNGCLRMPDNVIELLRERLPLGTPVDIVA